MQKEKREIVATSLNPKIITTVSSRIGRNFDHEGAAPDGVGSSNTGVRSRHQHGKAVGLSKETPSLRAGVGFIFEDKTILIIDKPAGMVVNRAKTTKEKTIQDWAEDYLKIKDRGIGNRAGIVHRLDKETSGLLIIAKTLEAFENLQKQFKERKVGKRYLALVHGKVEPEEGAIEASISRSPYNRKKFGVFLGGRPAKTKYKVKKYYGLENEIFSFLELTPETGRTHQIRVHLKYLGYPVVADEKYGGRKTARADRKWCSRQFLHASSLSFVHPGTGKKIKFACSLPAELKEVLRLFS